MHRFAVFATVVALALVIGSAAQAAISLATTSPLPGNTVSGTINWAVASTGSTLPSCVYFYVDGRKVGSDCTSAFGLALKTSMFSNASHTLKAIGKRKKYRSGSTQVSVTVSNGVADPTPPSAPTGLAVGSIGRSALALSWLASTDNIGIAGYRLYENGVELASVGASALAYQFSGLACSTAYMFGVQAYDVAGNVSPISSMSGSTLSCPPLPANPSAARLLGVTLPWSSTWLSDLDAYSSMVGRVPSLVQTFRDMEYPMLNPTEMGEVAARGSTPLVTVEPWDSSSTTDRAYALKNIVAGDFDSWFAAGATDARAYARPFYLRFAPEMNGNWSPWGAGVNGNTPQEYIAAWRHVHAIFVAHGATNALWVWAPNVFSSGGTAVAFTRYYPGSDVVDVLALDGYNWGSLDIWQTWSQIFGSSYDSLCALDPVRPVMIAETASTQLGGEIAAWITSAFTEEIPTRTPRVKFVVWFDENKETDWRIESSLASLSAYRAVATSSSWG